MRGRVAFSVAVFLDVPDSVFHNLMEAKAAVGRFDRLENLGMTVAERICRPTILEIDEAVTIQVPDKVTLRLIDYDLPYRTKSALPGSLHFGVEPQPVLE